MAFVDQHGVENVHECFVDEKSFEQRGYYRGSFSEHQKCAVDPGTDALEK